MTYHQRRGATGALIPNRAVPTTVATAPMVTATILVGSESDPVVANPLSGSVYVASQLDNRPKGSTMIEERAIERALLPARRRAQAEIRGIIEAAWQVLEATGWADLKIGMVLEEAHVSTRCFYRNFSGKPELLVALFDEEIAKFSAWTTEQMGGGDTPIERTLLWIACNLRPTYGANRRARAQLFAHEGPALAADFPRDVRRIRQLLLDPLVNAIEDGMRQGVFDVNDPAEAATVIWLITSSLNRDPEAGHFAYSEWPGVLTVVSRSALRILGVVAADDVMTASLAPTLALVGAWSAAGSGLSACRSRLDR